MRAAALSLILAAAPATAFADAPERAAPAPLTAPKPIVPVAPAAALAPAGAVPSSPPAPAAIVAPVPVQSPADAPALPAAKVPSQSPADAPAGPPAQGNAGTGRPAVPLQAVIDKLGQGDRAFLAGDYRTALFAYQDAVYMAPQNAAARVKLGRAYLALRYPSQAIAQAEQALAVEPGNEDARRLAQDAKNPPPRPVPPSAPAASPPEGAPSTAPAETTRVAQPRVYRLTPEPDVAAPSQPTRVGAALETPAPGRAAAATRPVLEQAVAAADPGTIAAQTDAATPAGPAEPTPGQRYRTALELLGKREFREAVRELSEAIASDPRLAVAYAARGSALFGLSRYREASEDYRTALGLDANLATPLYGLAECYRLLGDSAGAAEMYGRYAESRAGDVREDLRAIAAKRARQR